VSPDAAAVPFEATFTWSIAAVDAVSCSLDTGDGSALQNFDNCLSSQQTSHTYTQAGTFTVRLSLAGGASQTVTVTASPDLTATDTVLVGGFVDEQSRNVIVIMTDDGPKPKKASLDRLNAAIAKVDASLGVASEVPAIRGFNKAVLGLLQASQPEDEDAPGATRLFNFASEFVVAVTSDGSVVATSPLNRLTDDDDDSRLRFDLNVPVEQDVALLLAEPDGRGGWVCKGALEYQTLERQRTVASDQTLYRFPAELAGNDTALNTGRFQFNELTANLASRTAVTSTNVMAEDLPDDAVQDAILAMDDAPDFMDGRYAFCGNPNVVETNVNATINWLSESFNPFTTPSNASPDLALGEAVLYDFGIALLLETITEADDDGNMTTRNRLVGSAPIDPQGNVQLRVVRDALENLNASLFFTDVGYYDNDKRRFPLTPSYEFEGSATASAMSVAELSLQQDGPEQIDLGRLTGRMAYISGRTFARSGAESGNSTVIMALDAERPSFNIALAGDDGFYELFIPAEDEEDYIFYGEDQNDEFFGLVGNNVSGNRYEVRRGIVIEENISLSIPFDDDFLNSPPAINNLNDQAVLLDGEDVELTANVRDPDGDVFTLRWEVLSEPLLSTVFIENATEDTATFTPTREGTYIFELTASDGLAQVSDRVEVRVANNLVNFVNVGDDLTLVEGDVQPLTLERDSIDLASPLTINLGFAQSSDSDATDINLIGATALPGGQYEVVFAPGQASVLLDLVLLNDAAEGNETLVLGLLDEEDDNNYAIAEEDEEVASQIVIEVTD
ncbi:MAG: PKD domain-containing protein, partial [Deinococcota bacterium]